MFGKPKYCTTCGTVSIPKTVTKGSIVIELFLWLCLLLPGLIYSLWRVTSRHDGCRSCAAATLVPIDSPVAVRALAVAPELSAQRPARTGVIDDNPGA